MNYSDIKAALSGLTPSVTWPQTFTQPGYYYIINPAAPPAPIPTVNIAALETALATWIPNNPISQLINNLQSTPLGHLVTSLLDSLTIQELALSVGTPTAGVVPVIGFNFTLGLNLSTTPVCGLNLTSIGLELNFVDCAGILTWSPVLIADCTFLSVDCDVEIDLFAQSISLSLSEDASPNIDSMLQAAGGPDFNGLQQNMNITSTGTPTLAFFNVTATVEDSPTFSCLMVLDNLSAISWNNKFSLSALSIAFQHGGGSNVFSIAMAATIGGLNINGGITYQSAPASTTFTGAIPAIGLNLTDFLTQFFQTELNINNPLPSLPSVQLNGISMTLTESNGTWALQMTCGGNVVFDGLGTSLNFLFNFNKPSSGDTIVTLQLENLTFTFDATNTVFTLDSQGGISLDAVIKLLQIYPLYGLGTNIQMNLEKAILAFVSQPSGHHILFGAQVGLNATVNDSLLTMITGSPTIGLPSITLFAANAAWNVTELTQISTGIFPLSTPIPAGISGIPEIIVAGTTTALPLSPPNTNNTPTPPVPPSVPGSSANPGFWFNVQKQAGPVYINRIGGKLSNSSGMSIDLLCDAAFTVGPVTITLSGFSIDVPFSDPSQFSVSLQGLNISYDKPPVLISGGLLVQGNNTFVGDVTVQTETLSLSAIGEYADNGYTSLAFFAALTDPCLGGPVYCYITGLAAGGGYNSALNIPTDASQVANFALVQAASSGVPVSNPFQVIQNSVSPQQGENWIAVGIVFRSFELIQSVALLTAAFGQNFQFAILGQSEMSLPPMSSERIAYAQVDIEATYVPSNQSLQVNGILTQNSFILSPDCHLQGGFLYMLESNGTFIVSYGGYAPNFDYASLGYPAVPRLAIVWNIDSHTNVKGEAYCALCPIAMMAGGSLQATWDCGIFSAWLYIEADFLIQWRPFYYQIDFNISLGVSFDLKILFVHIHFSFHLGASLSIEGPPFHGHAHIDLSVISFDIDFGPSVSPPSALSWTDFRSMLPGTPANDSTMSDLLAVKVTNGLKQDLTQQSGDGLGAEASPSWVVNGTEFCFNIQTSVPITTASTGQVSVTLPPASVSVGILPMAVASATTTLDVVLTDSNGVLLSASTDPASSIVVTPINTNMASAHWGISPAQSANDPTLNCTAGYCISGGQPVPDHTSPVDLSVLLVTESNPIIAQSDRAATALPFSS